jgi:hypothetical protein
MGIMLAVCHVCEWHQTAIIDVKHMVTVCDLNAVVM